MEAILDPANLIMAVAGFGSFLTILAFGIPVIARDNFSSRLRAVARRREELLAQSNKEKQEVTASRLRQQHSKTYVKLVVERLKLLNPANSQDMRNQLAQAGMRGTAPLYTFVFLRFLLPILFGALTALYLFVLAKPEWSIIVKLLVTAGAAGIGFYLPKVLLTNKAQKRQQAITRAYPDALDLMVICVEAGLSMEAAFNRVAEEFDETSPELSEEMGLTTAELAFLPDRRVALENLALRTGLQSVKALVTALVQSDKYGTPVAVSLRVQANEQRDERMSKAEKKAGALPAQLTVPMIAFFLPVIFVVILGPAIIRTLDILSQRSFG
jgi:tight adherence protein C